MVDQKKEETQFLNHFCWKSTGKQEELIGDLRRELLKKKEEGLQYKSLAPNPKGLRFLKQTEGPLLPYKLVESPKVKAWKRKRDAEV